MSTILVVDDEPAYRAMLGDCLMRRGYNVEKAANGREAIDLGCRLQPDLLVTDWMLKDHIHGLHVSDVLHAVMPGMKTILITGFATQELRRAARDKLVFDFLEKPFEREQLEQAVDAALRESAPARNTPFVLPVLEIDAQGAISHVNAAAARLLGLSEGKPPASMPAKVFSASAPLDLARASRSWIDTAPAADESCLLHARARELNGGGWIVVLLKDDRFRFDAREKAVQLLLEIVEPVCGLWPFKGRALIIDDLEVVRRLVLTLFDRVGCLCHAASTRARGLELFERDTGVEFVVLDHDMPDPYHLADLVAKLKDIRPSVKLIGHSGDERGAEFAAVGVEHFIAKPWRIEAFMNMVIGRIGECVSCGLPIPLRYPQKGEATGAWVCCGCGARYRAVFDEYFPASVLSNVEPAPAGD